jgi:hypothetical protein
MFLLLRDDIESMCLCFGFESSFFMCLVLMTLGLEGNCLDLLFIIAVVNDTELISGRLPVSESLNEGRKTHSI